MYFKLEKIKKYSTRIYLLNYFVHLFRCMLLFLSAKIKEKKYKVTNKAKRVKKE